MCNISFVTDRDADDDVEPGEQVSAALIERRMAQSAPIIRRVIWSILGGLSDDFEPAPFVPPDAVNEVLQRAVEAGPDSTPASAPKTDVSAF